MKKIILFIISFIFIPIATNAVVNDYNLSSEIGGFSGMNFTSPFMILLNTTAAVVMIFSIVNLMVGWTIWHYIASGNVDEMAKGKEKLINACIGALYVIFVLMIDFIIR